MQYQLVRTARKTLALTVDRDGRLTVRAPLKMPASQIESFLTQKRGWIEKAQARMLSLPQPQAVFSPEEGARLPYLGQTLTVKRCSVSKISLSGEALLVPLSVTESGPVLRWLDTQARRELSARVNLLAKALSLYPKTLRLSHAKGRWGSMSTRGTLSLNRSLLLCPPEIIDYVIIHELCHITYPNHSAAFWAKVECCLPEYRIRRDWLKAHNALIRILPD